MTICFQVSKPKVSKRDFGCGYFWHVAQTHVARNSSDRFQVSKPKVSKREFLYTSKILFQVSKPKVSKRDFLYTPKIFCSKTVFLQLPKRYRADILYSEHIYYEHEKYTFLFPSFQTKSFQKAKNSQSSIPEFVSLWKQPFT